MRLSRRSRAHSLGGHGNKDQESQEQGIKVTHRQEGQEAWYKGNHNQEGECHYDQKYQIYYDQEAQYQGSHELEGQ